MPATSAPTHLHLTDDEEACRLLASDPAALVIGFVLDQQVTVQKAFRGPLDLRERVGTIEPAALADMPLDQLEAAFAEKPALHRFPGAMAKRVQAAMQVIVDEYGGDAARIWTEAGDLAEVERRIGGLPGFGPGKTLTMVTILHLRMGFPFGGWEDRAPEWGVLGEVESADDLKAYQTRKRAAKAAARAAKQRAGKG